MKMHISRYKKYALIANILFALLFVLIWLEPRAYYFEHKAELVAERMGEWSEWMSVDEIADSGVKIERDNFVEYKFCRMELNFYDLAFVLGKRDLKNGVEYVKLKGTYGSIKWGRMSIVILVVVLVNAFLIAHIFRMRRMNKAKQYSVIPVRSKNSSAP